MEIFEFLKTWSTVFMFAVFVAILLVTWWPGRRRRFDHDASIPLRDDR